MKDLINPLVLAFCSSEEVTNLYNDVLNFPYVENSSKYHLIRKITKYTLFDKIYCYQIITVCFTNGVKDESIYINNLTPDRFIGLIDYIRSFTKKGFLKRKKI